MQDICYICENNHHFTTRIVSVKKPAEEAECPICRSKATKTPGVVTKIFRR